MHLHYKVVCPNCNTVVFTPLYAKKYCSTQCREEHYELIKPPKKELNVIKCVGCNVNFKQKTSNQKYCTATCRDLYYETLQSKLNTKKLKSYTCPNCETTFQSSYYKKYCCQTCMKQYLSRRKLNKNKDGSSEIIEIRVKSILEKAKNTLPSTSLGVVLDTFTLSSFTEKIKEQVKDRDNFKCQICETNQEQLEVHHILKRKLGGDNSLDNLITLCVKCHRAIETGDEEHAIRVCLQNAKYLKVDDIQLTNTEKINMLTYCLESVFSDLTEENSNDISEILIKINNTLNKVT